MTRVAVLLSLLRDTTLVYQEHGPGFVTPKCVLILLNREVPVLQHYKLGCRDEHNPLFLPFSPYPREPDSLAIMVLILRVYILYKGLYITSKE